MKTNHLLASAVTLALASTAATAVVDVDGDPRFQRYHFDARAGDSVYHANHDNTGIPLDLSDERVSLSSALMDRIANALPEGRDVRNAEVNLITDDAGANITLSEDGEVFVTFIHEGAGFTNSFGYIAYDADNPPTTPDEVEHIVIFPNASRNGAGGGARGLFPGQQVNLGLFPAGTRLTFFVVAQGWTGDGVEPFGNPRDSWVRDLANSIDPYDWVFYSLQGLNPEPSDDLRAHTVLLNDAEEGKIILGLEDIRRTHSWCDHDFNDVLFAIESNPPTAIETENLLDIVAVADRDGDGVPDSEDDLPDDPLGAYAVTYPSADGHATLAFEDNWPRKGDYDMNDLVLRYRLEEIRTATGEVSAIRGDLDMKARGASYAAGFGFHFPEIDPSELYSAWVTIGDADPIDLTSEEGQSALTLILFENAKDLGNHSHWCWFFNTQDCAEVAAPPISFELVFAEPVDAARLGGAPYNPFIYRTDDRRYEVHLPNHPPTDLVPNWAIQLADDDSDPDTGRWFLSADNRPWALNMPIDWHHPREWISVDRAYPNFVPWAESGGTEHTDWYLYQHSVPSNLFQRTLKDAP
jgi:LruC domain-containing protein